MRVSFKRVLVLMVCLYSFKIAVHYVMLQSVFNQDYIRGHTQREMVPKLKPKDSVDKKRGVENRKSYYVGANAPDDMLRMKRPEYLENYKNPCWYERNKNKTQAATLKCLPYFRIIGVDKCGTTDLWSRLTKHPDIVRPKAVMGKETHWWSWRRFGLDIWVRNKPVRHFDWYLQHFDAPALQIEKRFVLHNGSSYHPLITGEGSPTEFWDFTGWNLIPQNKKRSPLNAILTPNCLYHMTPNLKSIVLVRNPTQRAYSDYLFLDQFRPIANLSARGFHQDVLTSIAMLGTCTDTHTWEHCLYDKDLHIRMPVRLIPGLYESFLSKWLQVFPRDQVLVLRNEDYSKNVRKHLQDIFHFLQIAPLSDKEVTRISSLPRVFEKTARAKAVGPMWNKTRQLLDAFYKRHNQMLASRLKDIGYLWNS